jgi:uncharacterized protein (TIGR00369 family)
MERITYQSLNPSFVDDVQGSFARQSIMRVIGAELTRVEAGLVEITLPFRQDLTQQNGYMHAGIITTIADSASGYAAYTLMPAGSAVLSVEFKVNFMRPAVGKKFVAIGEVLKPGRSLTVVRADVFGQGSNDGAAQRVAAMQATMICLR